MPLPFCVYILFSLKDKLLYIGFTSNLEKRIQRHNAGESKNTRSRRPLQLIFCEFCLFEEDARNREMYFKKSMGKKAIKFMLSNALTNLGYRPLKDGILKIEFDDSINETTGGFEQSIDGKRFYGK